MFVIALLFPFYTVQDPSLGKGRIYRGWAFPHQLSKSLSTPQTYPEAGLLGDTRPSKVDNWDNKQPQRSCLKTQMGSV